MTILIGSTCIRCGGPILDDYSPCPKCSPQGFDGTWPTTFPYVDVASAAQGFNNVVPFNAEKLAHEQPSAAARLTDQANFLRDMADQMDESAADVDRIAFAVLVRFKDGTTAIQADGFSSDAEAMRYFEAVMRSKLGFAS